MKPLVRIVAGVVVCGCAIAQAAHAGSAYIPLPGAQKVGPVSYRAEIAVTNTWDQQLTLEALQVGAETESIARREPAAARYSVDANRTAILRPGEARGLLGLNGDPELHYSAHLIGTGGAAPLRVDLPVIGADGVGHAGDMLVVQDLEGSRSKRADVVLVNLSDEAGTCSATVRRADGSAVVGPVTIEMAPLSQRFLDDVFGGAEITAARAEIACSGDFFVYAQMADRATGELAVVVPARSSDTTSPLFDDLKKAAATCSNDSTVCERDEPFTSTKKAPTLALSMTPPPATYASMKGHVDVLIHGWSGRDAGAHGVLYVIINRNKYLIGNVFLRGPGSNLVTMRHNICPNGCNKEKVQAKLAAAEGETYSFDYEYNPRQKTVHLVVTHGDEVVAELHDKPNVNNIFIHPGDKVVIGLSNPFVNSREEPASVGWTYTNLKVELFE